MTLIAICTTKGTAGATTTAVGLAAVLPAAAGALVIEADPGGGDLSLRYGQLASRGLVSLAQAARGVTEQHQAQGLVGRHASAVPVADVEIDLVAAPASGHQTRAALSVLAARPWLLGPPGRVAVADCGRLEPHSLVSPIIASSDLVVVLVSATAAAVSRLVDYLPHLSRTARRVGIAVTAGGPYRAREVSHFLTSQTRSAPVWASLPHDPRTAHLLGAGSHASPRWRRRPLAAALTTLRDALGPAVDTPPPSPDVFAADATGVVEVDHAQ